ncbi:MAG TPA: VTT domain-containing protein [Pyrinomonadaceae bacterium]
MKLWHKVGGALAQLAQYLVTFGAAGLFTIALLDSVAVPLPGGVDAVMLLLSTARPSYFPLYAAGATLGSTVGCIILYYVSRRAGRRALARFSERKQARVRDLLERYDVLAVLVASLLPPPFPFKLFVISSGVFRMNVVRFAVAIAAGRAFRFLLEGYLAARYGAHAKELLAQYYPYVGLGLAVLLVAGFAARAMLKGRGQRAEVRGQSESKV